MKKQRKGETSQPGKLHKLSRWRVDGEVVAAERPSCSLGRLPVKAGTLLLLRLIPTDLLRNTGRHCVTNTEPKSENVHEILVMYDYLQNREEKISSSAVQEHHTESQQTKSLLSSDSLKLPQ